MTETPTPHKHCDHNVVIAKSGVPDPGIRYCCECGFRCTFCSTTMPGEHAASCVFRRNFAPQ